MMKALIVEDEIPARESLIRALERVAPDIRVVGATVSVKETLEWLRTPGNKADVFFMDVELQDGSSFEILRQEDVKAKIIMTTAYDKYAVKAFEAGSVDYLLKPFDDSGLLRAVGRCRVPSELDGQKALMAAMRILERSKSEQFRRRLVIRLGRQIIPVPTSEIAYFYVEGKNKYIVMDGGTRYYMDRQTDAVLKELDPQLFFRVSRNYILSFHAIRQIETIPGGRLKVNVAPQPEEEVIVARLRVQDFLNWLE